ncbi:MAG TPA: hypothetical protein VEC19_08900 [Usitatibacter sp.]|nr:hypothetical protein [Usitatibacter sp.]
MTKSALFAALAIALSGCAASPENSQLAQAECKVAPLTAASATGRAHRSLTPIEQRYAEMQLANTEFRRRQLQERGLIDNNIEQALRDCATR